MPPLFLKEEVATHSVDGGVKKAVSIELTAFFCVFCFLRTSKYKASKKSTDFLERGKTYVVYLQNYVLFYTEYVLTRYSNVRKKTKFRTFLNSLSVLNTINQATSSALAIASLKSCCSVNTSCL